MSGEAPNIVYGRLLESAHFTGYGLERVCSELEWLLDEGRWREVGPGYDDVNVFMASVELIGISLEQRKSIARKLNRELKLSLRQAATAARIGTTTLHNELYGRSRANTVTEKASDLSDATLVDRSHANAQTSLSGREAAAHVREVEQRRLKEIEREAKREHNRGLVERAPQLADINERFPTVVLDPPWDWSDEGDVDQFGRATPTYATMPFEEIAAQPIANLAATDAHLYLWITNRSLPKGFELLEQWGFRYVTTLTWVKPSIGMGNYFRGSTEHVLFGVRGSLPLLRKDVGTSFHADRPPEHSRKPDAFYQLVETCSPGPWFDWPARQTRNGWAVSGAEVPA